HITVIATISTSDAPVPPFIIYPGMNLMQDWTKVRDPTPNQLATVTDTGYINTYTMQRWLKECFDPSTRDRAEGPPRLLILDGHETHTNIDFLDACWERNIICLILPAHLSGVFQPLDVNFFNDLKLKYYEEISDYQLGSESNGVGKPFFYRWHQRAWSKTATSRQIRSAWAESHLYPIGRVYHALQENHQITPPPPENQNPLIPTTPTTMTSLSELDQMIQRGEITPRSTLKKTRSGLEKVMAEKILLERDMSYRQAAEELDREARSKKRQRYPQGHLFSLEYRDSHADELEDRRVVETQRREERKRTGGGRR
ncbi:hypothetical protein TREMEDRAFT_15010, partial [Tremella mesenterica DSM 1558]|uniref:uncharacterized protein n=1 Tax=Tremella mesenterica (strain ATCC 24925 / CBS 8224 / DSM 1558 / NBRC 9311 / NRRL Y-6157 / RJB 2259-6 / UBC 559-6) TaxID=578456 RepID=UPI0003F49C82